MALFFFKNISLEIEVLTQFALMFFLCESENNRYLVSHKFFNSMMVICSRLDRHKLIVLVDDCLISTLTILIY
jgi:hypothetical protein